jgi:hypothetical protein
MKIPTEFIEYKHLMKKAEHIKCILGWVLEQLPRKIPFTKCLHLQHFRRECFFEEILVGREMLV